MIRKVHTLEPYMQFRKANFEFLTKKNIYLSFKCIPMIKAKKIIVSIQAPKTVLD